VSAEVTPAILILIMKIRTLIETHVGRDTTDGQQELIKDAYGSSYFKCRIFACPNFQQGFSSRGQRDSHVQIQHIRPFKCTYVDCAFYTGGLRTRAALDNHLSWAHDAMTLPLRFPKVKPQSIWKSLEDAIDCDNAILVQTLCAGVSEVPKEQRLILRATKNGCFLSARVLVGHTPFLEQFYRDHSTMKRVLSITSQAGERELMLKILSFLNKNLGYQLYKAIRDFALSEDNVEVARLMLDTWSDMAHRTLRIFSIAASSGCDGIIDMFLVNAKRLNLDCRNFESAANLAAKKDHHLLARKLLEAGNQDGARGHYSKALQRKQALGLDEMVKFVVEKVSGTIKDSSKGTTWGNALQEAAHKGDNDRIEALLQEGADINHTESRRGTAIQAASRRGHVETVKLLLDKGANTTIYSTAQLRRRFFHRRGQRVLIEAARCGHKDLVSFLLECDPNSSVNLRSPSEIEEATGDWTPLHFAAERGHGGVMRTLLTRGADPDAKSKDLTTPLHLAVRAKRTRYECVFKKGKLQSTNGAHKDVVSLLLEHRADAMARDSEGNTPLHRIFFNKVHPYLEGPFEVSYAVDVAKLLMEAGADLQTRNHKGLTPREFALLRGSTGDTFGKNVIDAINMIDPQTEAIRDR
jgi:ankyrin repeat protein